MKIIPFRRKPEARFRLVDRTGKWDDHREIVSQPVILEPHDDHSDMCVSIPVRSVISATAGIAIEVGPYTLDSSEVVKLHNALADHINSFPSEYRIRAAAGVEATNPKGIS